MSQHLHPNSAGFESFTRAPAAHCDIIYPIYNPIRLVTLPVPFVSGRTSQIRLSGANPSSWESFLFAPSWEFGPVGPIRRRSRPAALALAVRVSSCESPRSLSGVAAPVRSAGRDRQRSRSAAHATGDVETWRRSRTWMIFRCFSE